MPVTVKQLERMVRDGRYRPTTFSDGRHNWRRWEASFAGNCQNPVTVELNARPTRKDRKMVEVPSEGKSMTVSMEVPCRLCENCLKRRAAHWRIRTLAELRAGEAVGARTWLTTLTIEPMERQRLLDRLRSNIGYKRERKPGESVLVDFESLDESEQFQRKHAEISKEITRYMKRVRENSGAMLRHIVICERHEGGGQLHGEPHYHVLWHECRPDQPLRQRVLVDAWKLGFSHNRLVKDRRQALYVAKYLQKSSLARVRASLGYGTRPDDIVR